jgi:predicted HicB family RNase H-like nuclease
LWIFGKTRLFFSGQSRFPDSGGAGVSVAFTIALTKIHSSHIISQNESGGKSMSQITLRDLAPDIEKMIRLEARKSKKSLNRVIQEMLQLKTDSVKKKPTPRGQSLKNLAGGWSDQEAAEFFESIKSCEQIDEDMWK